MMILRIFLLTLCLCSTILPAQAAALSAADQADIARAQAYLNAVTTLKARFLQVSPNGQTVEGDVYLSRPGLLRLDYDPPSPIQVIANGRFLIYFDKDLQQTSYIGLDDTPAGILLKPQVEFNGREVRVTDIGRQPGVLMVTMVQTKDPKAGDLTLVFSENPFTLRQWRVTDPQGNVTTVSLFGAQSGIALDKKLFQFRDPNFYKRDDR